MSELKRYQFDEDGFEKTSDADEGDFIEFVRVADMKALVQPLVDALERVLPMVDSMNDDLFGGSGDWDANNRISVEAKERLAAYRKAMGEQ